MKRILSRMLVAAAVLMVSALPAFATLVVNGGFETGDFTGWTHGGYTADTDVSDWHVHTGTYAAHLGPVGSDGILSQALATTPGQSYTVSFWLQSGQTLIDANTPNDFHLSWDGGVIFSLVNAPLFGYTQYSFVTQATSSSTTLSFGFRNDPTYFFLDDVDVSPVPIPGAVWLLGSGIVGLIGLKRRMRK